MAATDIFFLINALQSVNLMNNKQQLDPMRKMMCILCEYKVQYVGLLNKIEQFWGSEINQLKGYHLSSQDWENPNRAMKRTEQILPKELATK